MTLPDILVLIALAAVFITLCFGIFALFRGGEFGRSYSNKLMRLRVALQFVAVIVVVAVVWWKNH
jgi:ABC-type dipeptide/oligopeptide/nickel transport system permease subunit